MGFLYWPYVEGASGWGTNTSMYNWCEMDYYMTPYVAEFINTLTNVGYVCLGLKGISNNRRNGNDTVVNICYFFLICVGIGSAIYHANPKYFSQMIDEFSMLFATAAILYGALSIGIKGKARTFVAVLLSTLVVAIAAVHSIWGNVKAFRLCFLTMVLSVFIQCVFTLPAKVPAADVRRNARNLALYGSGTFFGGLIFWRTDREYCAHLTAARDVVGMPLGFMMEFHGWWHILTGIGVYYYIVFIEYLRLYITAGSRGKGSPQPRLIWASRLSLPRVGSMLKPQSKS